MVCDCQWLTPGIDSSGQLLINSKCNKNTYEAMSFEINMVSDMVMATRRLISYYDAMPFTVTCKQLGCKYCFQADFLSRFLTMYNGTSLKITTFKKYLRDHSRHREILHDRLNGFGDISPLAPPIWGDRIRGISRAN